MNEVPIGDPRAAGESGPAGDMRAPGEEGPAGDPRKAGEPSAPTRASSARFDPGEHTVAEVNDHLHAATDDERQRVIAAEKAGKNRASITG